MKPLDGKRAVVVGASQGLGRGVTVAFAGAGASVLAVARNTGPLDDFAAKHPQLKLLAGDAADPTLAGTVLTEEGPDILALVAGARPLLRPLHHHTWETFSSNWNTDVRIAFNWIREALLLPLAKGAHIIVMSSAAAIVGSPLSGGYAGAKATERFIAEYAAQESRRNQLGIIVSAVLPKLTPATSLGRPAVAAYASRAGVSEAAFVNQMGGVITPEIVGAAFIRLAADGMDSEPAVAYELSADGLRALPSPAPGANKQREAAPAREGA